MNNVEGVNGWLQIVGRDYKFLAIQLLFAIVVSFGLLTRPNLARSDDGNQVVVFAAASLKSALDEIVAYHEAETGDEVVVSYAGSSALARQIEQGAPADVFISANADWMDWLEDRALIDAESRIDWVTNRLVLVAPVTSEFLASVGAELEEDTDLVAMLGNGRLAMALVDAVPAGIYGKAALQSMGQWEGVSGRVAQTDNVRAALALVALGAAPLGIVYASDARAEPGVKVLGVFPEEAHGPIVYPVARVKRGIVDPQRDAAIARFMDALASARAKAVLMRQGFSLPGGGS